MHNLKLRELGIPKNGIKLAGKAIQQVLQNGLVDESELESTLEEITASPTDFVSHIHWRELAALLVKEGVQVRYDPFCCQQVPYCHWGEDLDAEAHEQMRNACRLPVAVKGALMPDAHVGYGLPIGGVLATRDAVIPYAVGVDIGCRMKLSLFDLPPSMLQQQQKVLINALEQETRFGYGVDFGKQRRQHAVMDADWSVTKITQGLKDKAWGQLGTSGSGNHFVEFGIVTFKEAQFGLPAASYLALLSHSGSRGAGAKVAEHYSSLAQNLHPELPKELQHLAWLDLQSQAGQEYWNAMQLMGDYAKANHDCIHLHIGQALQANVLVQVENHHNFAWEEEHEGQKVIVHRKGATPAGEGVLGIIPGSMATPAYIVRGKGNVDSLQSAAHGAGRKMSRTQAKNTFDWPQTKELLKARDVTLLSAGLDEVPMAYKDIEQVIAAQTDLVEIIACFEPKLVKMALSGERPED